MLPTANWFRGPTRFFVVTAFGLAMLAGMGVDALARDHVDRKRVLVLLGGAATAAAVAAAVVLHAGTDTLRRIGQYLEGSGVGLPGELSFSGRLLLLALYRHTFASRLRMSGVELGTIRDLLGHTTTRMTERYAHITPGHLHDAVQRISRTGTKTGTGDRVDDEPLRAVASNRAPTREKSECPRRDSNPRYRRERPTS